MFLHACLIVLVLSGFANAFAFDPIPITFSHTMNKIIFDGKWSFEYEWKASSLNTYLYDDGTEIILRSAHQDNFVYLFLDAISDPYLDKMSDYAVVCFDTKNDKTTIPNSNDYCFTEHLEEKNSFTYRGDDTSPQNNYFKKVSNPVGFMGISAVSDHNDRYTPMPHPSYEFKIPTATIGRESVYGFYFLVYDGHTKKTYSYPENIKLENSTIAPSPSVWGEIYSPDKSLPEFDFPVLALFLSLVLAVYIRQVKMRNDKITRSN